MKRLISAGWAIVAAAGVALVLALSALVQEARADTTPWQNLTQSQLTAVWWQWVFSVPVSDNPLFDDTGADAYNGQPYSDLLFLGGTTSVTQLQNGDLVSTVTRSISVRSGTALFFPLLNAEWDNICGKPNLGGNCFGYEKFPYVVGVPDLRAIAASAVGSATGLYATLTPTNAKFKKATGPTQTLTYLRLQSPPFSYSLPATDNFYQYYGIDVSGTVSPVVGDGYYTFIRPGDLGAGYYLLQFGGKVVINDVGNTFTLAITYRITVTE